MIGRNWKLSYSRSYKEQSQKYQNVGIFESTKLRLTITSSRWWFWLLHKTILIPSSFIRYFKHLSTRQNENNNYKFQKISLILDNWPSNRADFNINDFRSHSWNIYYPPPYSPQLASMEYAFNDLKRRFTWSLKERTLKLNNVDTWSITVNMIKPVTAKSVRDYLSRLYDNLVNIYL